jgi:transcriptional regulator with XRE-family HTH domain
MEDKLGPRVKRLRDRAGLTQGELAQKAGLDRSMISKIESGHRENVSRNTLVQLMEALGVTVDVLLGVSIPGLTQEESELVRCYKQLQPSYQCLASLHLDFLLHAQAETRSGAAGDPA